MHELAVTQSLLDLTLRHARALHARRVTRINVVVSQLSTLADTSVRFYWQSVARDTLAEHAVLVFTRAPARVRCLDCTHSFVLTATHDYRCPICGSADILTHGDDELRLASIEIE